jgi:hypothetical protein
LFYQFFKLEKQSINWVNICNVQLRVKKGEYRQLKLSYLLKIADLLDKLSRICYNNDAAVEGAGCLTPL